MVWLYQFTRRSSISRALILYMQACSESKLELVTLTVRGFVIRLIRACLSRCNTEKNFPSLTVHVLPSGLLLNRGIIMQSNALFNLKRKKKGPKWISLYYTCTVDKWSSTVAAKSFYNIQSISMLYIIIYLNYLFRSVLFLIQDIIHTLGNSQCNLPSIFPSAYCLFTMYFPTMLLHTLSLVAAVELAPR